MKLVSPSLPWSSYVPSSFWAFIFKVTDPILGAYLPNHTMLLPLNNFILTLTSVRISYLMYKCMRQLINCYQMQRPLRNETRRINAILENVDGFVDTGMCVTRACSCNDVAFGFNLMQVIT